MTQQYVVGELTSWLGNLQSVDDESLASAIRDLRREVENCSAPRLRPLAHRAVALSETICWHSLNRGDLAQFCRDVDKAVGLRNFAISANLLS